MLAPMLVQMERQIDREILLDARRAGGAGAAGGAAGAGGSEEEEDEEDEGVGGGVPAPPMVYGPMPQIITNDLKSLDEMVSRFFCSHLNELLFFYVNSGLKVPSRYRVNNYILFTYM